MKRFLFHLGICLCLVASFSACSDQGGKNGPVPDANAPAEALDISFKLSNAPSGLGKVIGTIGSTNFLLDSILPENGLYQLKYDTAIAPGLYFFVLPNDVAFQFLIDKDQSFGITADVANPVASAVVEGSQDNDLLYQNLKFEKDFQARIQPLNQQLAAQAEGSPGKAQVQSQIDALIEERKAHLKGFNDNYPNTFFTLFKNAGQNPTLKDIRKADGSLDEAARIFHYRNEFWDNTPLTDIRILRTPIVYNKLKTYITQITPQVHDSVVKYADIVIEKARPNKEAFKFIVNWIAIEYHKPKQMGMESVFVHVVDKYFTDQDAFWSTADELKEIRREVNEMRPSLIGMVGQDIRCKNVNGQYESLYDLRGPATILYVWNYECEHCQERTPVMKQVFDKYKSRGLQIYSLCTGADEKLWKEFINKYGIQQFHNVFDPKYESNFYKKYHIDVTPEVFVMDINHIIVSKDLHPNQLEPVLDPMLK